MSDTTYSRRRGELETYFDRTAVQAWMRLTSDAPVGRIRATVRAGRDAMRATLLSFLPDDLRGARILDAGCGTGALALEAAARGGTVVATDLSPTLVGLARERAAGLPGAERVTFHVGDMLSADLGDFDHVVAMDSLIHYRADDVARALAAFAPRTSRSIVFTFAPWNPALALMHAAGRLFPRADRAPAVEPVREAVLRRRIAAEPALRGWQPGAGHRISTGFYISQAMELRR
ncbi:magnesium protoporphyrin IX methyltransferase [Roseomonas nepalensis]|uniref:Magnesium protoporphyrin IX methyltransferase n=1 Tax=Muricoccus nepalensis TaxID=1854500 RepID=A0A502G8S3_9PROT|nr:magnesium protoporphyrin IX methyltransferase [Roseomonas nepalensis]TPG58547.1 magnesium protoporphyrin IX methyltransferase [Roseomonas nepalensis]